MFFGDNGRIEPRGIHWCYDTGLHAPMIIRWPEGFPAPANYRPGTVKDEVVSLIDLTSTTLGFARDCQTSRLCTVGSFWATWLGPKEPMRSPLVIEWTKPSTACSVRGKRYHYIRNFYPDRHFTSLNRYKEKCFPSSL